MAGGKRLQKLVETLAKKYETEGRKGELTELRDPFLVGAWYILGRHSKRNGQARAFEALRRAKGITPGQLLDLPPEKLTTICQIAGPYDDARCKELYAFADTIEEKCGQDFARIFKKPLPEVRKYLENDLRKSREFADLMLMYAGFPVFAVDIRIARAAARLGLVKLKNEKVLDEKSYKDVQKALEAEVPSKSPSDWLIRAHGLMHRLGADTCHTSNPSCESCTVSKECAYLKKHPVKPKEPVEYSAYRRHG